MNKYHKNKDPTSELHHLHLHLFFIIVITLSHTTLILALQNNGFKCKHQTRTYNPWNPNLKMSDNMQPHRILNSTHWTMHNPWNSNHQTTCKLQTSHMTVNAQRMNLQLQPDYVTITQAHPVFHPPSTSTTHQYSTRYFTFPPPSPIPNSAK